MVQSIFKFLKCLGERRLPQNWVFLPSGELSTPEIKIASVTVPTFKDNKRVSKRNVIPQTMYSLQGLSQDFSKGGHTLSNKGYSPQFSPPECCRSFAQRHTNRGSQAPQSVIFMKKEVSSCKMSNVIFEINVINITWKHFLLKTNWTVNTSLCVISSMVAAELFSKICYLLIKNKISLTRQEIRNCYTFTIFAGKEFGLVRFYTRCLRFSIICPGLF